MSGINTQSVFVIFTVWGVQHTHICWKDGSTLGRLPTASSSSRSKHKKIINFEVRHTIMMAYLMDERNNPRGYTNESRNKKRISLTGAAKRSQ